MTLKENNWLGRSLKNYQAEPSHQQSAKSRDNLDAFFRAKTLTQARKLAYGVKSKQQRLAK